MNGIDRESIVVGQALLPITDFLTLIELEITQISKQYFPPSFDSDELYAEWFTFGSDRRRVLYLGYFPEKDFFDIFYTAVTAQSREEFRALQNSGLIGELESILEKNPVGVSTCLFRRRDGTRVVTIFSQKPSKNGHWQSLAKYINNVDSIITGYHKLTPQNPSL